MRAGSWPQGLNLGHFSGRVFWQQRKRIAPAKCVVETDGSVEKPKERFSHRTLNLRFTVPTTPAAAGSFLKHNFPSTPKDWESPADGDARIMKMKDGRTHLAHKAEHAVDLDTGAVVAVTLQGADQGDTVTLDATLSEAGMAVAELVKREAEQRPEDTPKVNVEGMEEMVADKGYHSGAVLERVKSYEVRTYIPEKKQAGQRHWEGKTEEQQAVYQNRRRVRGGYGKSLLRRRGELVERSFAH